MERTTFSVMFFIRRTQLRKNLEAPVFLRITVNGDRADIATRRIFYKSDLIKPLFFKDGGDDVPICYCSDLTRGEIKDAVKNGCRTIDEVRSYTKKDITGLCDTVNPTGKCCNNVFKRVIAGK